ncbi:hypothetical protein DDZ14_16290 [Maritimibacter sp. 55A14]|uniref:hypothetical protein n=1 Tax=Maritimibacter sp. 55A14 TaxID=2174844 RepID=UPI000D606134|nr:hypothetical protein [Maritimibacter sp. 55A14]PWE29999.1 hypothetical protein DDZ14_16290 [Maritimibacter sp. 55A14]
MDLNITVTLVLGVVGSLVAWTTQGPLPVKLGLSIFAIGAILMLAVAQNERQHAALVDWIEGDGYGNAYWQVVAPRLARIWTRLCDPAPSGTGFLRTLWAALTWRLYDLALLIAVLYPILALVLPWAVTGKETGLGAVPVLKAIPRYSLSHIATLGIIAMFFVAIVYWLRPEYRRAKGVTRTDILLFAALAVTFGLAWLEIVPAAVTAAVTAAGGVAITVLAAGATAIAVTAAITAAGAAAVTVAGAAAVTVAAATAVIAAAEVSVPSAAAAAVTVLVTVAVIAALGWMYLRGYPALAHRALTCLLVAVLAMAAYTLPWADVPPFKTAVFLFFGVFPILNALFDLLSYAVTVALVRLGLRMKRWPAFLLGLLDLFIAGALFFALGAALVVTTALLNRLSSGQIADIGGILGQISQGWSTTIAWAYFMVFSTLVPTLFHLVLTLISLERMALPFLRQPFAKLIRQARDPGIASVLAPCAAGVALLLPFTALYCFFWLVWTYLGNVLALYGRTYLNHLLTIAQWIEAI